MCTGFPQTLKISTEISIINQSSQTPRDWSYVQENMQQFKNYLQLAWIEVPNNITIGNFDVFEDNMPIAHAISSDLHQTAGIAGVLRQNYFKNLPKVNVNKSNIGTLYLYPNKNLTRQIIGLITKDIYYLKPTYASLFTTLIELRKYLINNKIKNICLPMVGCNKDKLNPLAVLPMLMYCLGNIETQVKITNKGVYFNYQPIPVAPKINKIKFSKQMEKVNYDQTVDTFETNYVKPKKFKAKVTFEPSLLNLDSNSIIINESKTVKQIYKAKLEKVIYQRSTVYEPQKKTYVVEAFSCKQPKPIVKIFKMKQAILTQTDLKENNNELIKERNSIDYYKFVTPNTVKAIIGYDKVESVLTFDLDRKRRCGEKAFVHGKSLKSIAKRQLCYSYVPSLNSVQVYIKMLQLTAQKQVFGHVVTKIQESIANMDVHGMQINNIPEELMKSLSRTILEQLQLDTKVIKPVLLANILNCFVNVVCALIIIFTAKSKVASGAAIVQIISNILTLMLDIGIYYSLKHMTEERIKAITTTITQDAVQKVMKQHGVTMMASDKVITAMQNVDLNDAKSIKHFIKEFEKEEDTDISEISPDCVPNYSDMLPIGLQMKKKNRLDMDFVLMDKIAVVDPTGKLMKIVSDCPYDTPSKNNQCLLHSLLGALDHRDRKVLVDESNIEKFFQWMSDNISDPDVIEAINVYKMEYASDFPPEATNLDVLQGIKTHKKMLPVDLCKLLSKYLDRTIIVKHVNKVLTYGPERWDNNIPKILQLENQHFSYIDRVLVDNILPLKAAVECMVQFTLTRAAQFNTPDTLKQKEYYLAMAAAYVFTYNSRIAVCCMNVKSNKLDAKSIIGICTDILSTIAFVVGMGVSSGDFASRMVKAEKFSTSMDTFASRTTNKLDSILSKAFGIYMSEDGETVASLSKDIDILEKYKAHTVADYMNNMSKYQEVKTYVEGVTKRMTSLHLLNRDTTNAIQNTQNIIRKSCDAIMAVLNDVDKLNRMESLRQEFVGLKGAGKTSTLNNYLIPNIAKRLALNPSTYAAEIDANGHWKPYRYEDFALIDDLFNQGSNDPFIPHIVRMASSLNFDLPGADLSNKEKTLRARFLFATANVAYVRMKEEMPASAQEGFYGRFKCIQFINAKQGINQARDSVEYIDYEDHDTYELRMYEEQINEQFSQIERNDHITGERIQHFDPSTKTYDDHIYKIGHLHYKIVTFKQLETICIDQFNKKYQHYKMARDRKCVVDFEYFRNIDMKSDAIVENMVRKGYLPAEIEAARQTVGLTAGPDEVHAKSESIINHYVVSVFGDTGTGKSVFATQLALDLSDFLNLKVYSVEDINDTAHLDYLNPSIIVFHDSIYDELKYVALYDKLPKPCLIITTSNHTLKWHREKLCNIVDNSTSAAERSSSALLEHGFFNKMKNKIGGLVSYFNLSSIREGYLVQTFPGYQPTPGYCRRLGLNTAFHPISTEDLTSNLVYSQRPNKETTTIFATSGYHFHQDNKEVQLNEVVKEVLMKYRGAKKFIQPDIIKLGVSEFEEQFKKLTTIDVEIQSKNIESLIKLTNDRAILVNSVTAARFVGGSNIVKVSSRVRSNNYSFNPLDFAIPINATVSDALDIAMKSYRLLLSANVDYTVFIKCEEFSCIGINGNIYYTSVPFNVTSYSHIATKVITFYKVDTNSDGITNNSELIKFTPDEYAKLIITGEGEQKLFDKLPYAACKYIYGARAEIEPHFATTFTKYEVRTEVYDNHTREKMAFFVIYSEFKKTIWYKIAIGILAITASVLIIELITQIWNMFIGLKEVFTSTVQKDNVKVVYQVLSVNPKEQSAEVKVYGFKDDLDSFSNKELSNLIIDDIDVAKLDDSIPADTVIKALDMSQMTVHSDWNKKDFAKNKVPTLVHRMLDMRVHSDKSQDNKKISRKANRVERILENMTVKGEFDFIKHKITNSLGKVVVSASGVVKTVVGMNIKGHYVICPAHVYPVDTAFHYANFTPFNTGKNYTMVPMVCSRVDDLALFYITDKLHPLAKDITHHFDDQERLYTRPFELPYMHLRTGNVVSWKGGDAIGLRSLVTKVHQDMLLTEGKPMVAGQFWSTVTRLTKGDCGFPIIDTNSHKIFSIYCGDNNGVNAIYGNMVTSTLVKKMIDFAEGVSEVHAFTRYSPPMEEFFDAEDTGVMKFSYPSGEQHIVMPVETCDYISKAYETENYYPCMDGEFTRNIAYSSDCQKNAFMKPKYQRTPFAEEILTQYPQIKDDCRNAATDPRLVEDKSKLVNSVKGDPSIVMTQLAKINDPIDAAGGLMGEKFMEEAAEMLTEEYIDLYSGFDHRFLTTEETINGIASPQSDLQGHLEAVNRDASAGHWCMLNGYHKISDLLEEGGSYPSGQLRYHFKKENKVIAKLEKHISQQKKMWAKGIRYEGLTKDNLKAELRPFEKVRIGKTRVFESFDFFTTFNHRQLFGTIQAAMKKQRARGTCQIGLAQYDFTHLYNRLLQTSPFAVHGDFEAWDKHMDWFSVQLACKMWTKVLWKSPQFQHWNDKINAHKFECEENLYLMLETAMFSNVYAVTLADGHIIVKERSQCSGVVETTTLNSTVNDIKCVAVILYLIKKHNVVLRTLGASEADARKYYEDYLETLELSKKSRKALLTSKHIYSPIIPDRRTIKQNFDMIYYGDDIGIVVNLEFLFIVNFVSIKNAYKYLFGINLDSPHKDGSLVPFVPLNELEFVSRTFDYHSDTRTVYPKLKEQSIWRLLFWCTNLRPEQIESNMIAMANELFLYEESKYRLFSSIVNAIISPYLKRQYNWNLILPSYRLGRVAFEEMSHELKEVPHSSTCFTELEIHSILQKAQNIGSN